jgi:hypothetical protein
LEAFVEDLAVGFAASLTPQPEPEPLPASVLSLTESVAVGLDLSYEPEGFPRTASTTVSDNLTTPSTFRTDIPTAQGSQGDVISYPFDREGFPRATIIPVSDNFTTTSTFRTDVLAVICP